MVCGNTWSSQLRSRQIPAVMPYVFLGILGKQYTCLSQDKDCQSAPYIATRKFGEKPLWCFMTDLDGFDLEAIMLRKLLFQSIFFKFFVSPCHLCEELGTCEEWAKKPTWWTESHLKAQRNSSLLYEYPGCKGTVIFLPVPLIPSLLHSQLHEFPCLNKRGFKCSFFSPCRLF